MRIIACFVLIFLVACSVATNQVTPLPTAPFSEEIQVLSDGTTCLVHPEQLRSGGPPKDGIPSIDTPQFETVQEADQWLTDEDLVVVLQYKGEKRVYPFDILVWHEIVNDVVAGDPLLITYCPLCGSVVVYERTLEDEAVEFGTTGQLYQSNLVMYDRKTDTFWTQIRGTGIIGALTGHQLTRVNADTTTWGAWKTTNPESKVLSRNTGFQRPYGEDPYGNYYATSQLIFPVDNVDDRLHPKTVVFGIDVEGHFRAYKEADLIAQEKITDVVGGIPLMITRDATGIVTIIRTDTQAIIPKERDFWFAWYAFHPETTLYER